MRLRTLGCVALLGVAACGNNDKKLEREVRALCDAIQPGTTIRQAEQSIGEATLFIGCQSNLLGFDGSNPGACGEPASVCVYRWQWQSSSDCNAAGGCAYVCDVRVRDEGPQPSSDAQICERRFLTGQGYYY